MGKMLALLLIIVLALASVAGYLFLTEQITAGERQIADGQRQLEKGQPVLEEGKAKLEAGKQEMSESKKEYKQAKDNLFLVLADKLLEGGKGFKDAKERIVEGDKQVAKGEGEVNVGERRIDAVELELRRGRELLMLAKGARVACALVAAFFASLSIVLGFCWRRSLARILMHTDA
jgi:predicted  nucleic acid-binding Zn-ribbon protein